MFNTAGMFGAFCFMSLLLTAALYYSITRWIHIFNGAITNKLGTLLTSFLIVLVILGMMLSQFNAHPFFAILSSIGSRLIMLVLILTILLAIEHLISFLLTFTPLSPTKRGNRRGRGTLVLLISLFGYGIFQSLTSKITETTITTDKIPHDLNIMLVADFHVDDMISTLHLKELKKQIELQKPDLVLIAGDFFNRANVRLAQHYEALSGITTPMYAVEGNHDTMGEKEGVLALRHIQDLTNIKFLSNESLTLPDMNIQLIGLEEAGKRRRDSTIDEVLGKSNIQDGPTFNILMTHQPISLKKLIHFPIDLEVAGHTHRGQVRGIRALIPLMNDYGYGRYEEQGKIAFVTQGIGTRGLPVRLGTKSEIVLIHLQKS